MPTAFELRELDDVELEDRLGEYRKELLNLGFQLATRQLHNAARAGEVKRAGAPGRHRAARAGGGGGAKQKAAPKRRPRRSRKADDDEFETEDDVRAAAGDEV